MWFVPGEAGLRGEGEGEVEGDGEAAVDRRSLIGAPSAAASSGRGPMRGSAARKRSWLGREDAQDQEEKDGARERSRGALYTPAMGDNGGGTAVLRGGFWAAWGRDSSWGLREMEEGEEGFL